MFSNVCVQSILDAESRLSVVCNLLQTEEMNLFLLRKQARSRVMSLALTSLCSDARPSRLAEDLTRQNHAVVRLSG